MRYDGLKGIAVRTTEKAIEASPKTDTVPYTTRKKTIGVIVCLLLIAFLFSSAVHYRAEFEKAIEGLEKIVVVENTIDFVGDLKPSALVDNNNSFNEKLIPMLKECGFDIPGNCGSKEEWGQCFKEIAKKNLKCKIGGDGDFIECSLPYIREKVKIDLLSNNNSGNNTLVTTDKQSPQFLQRIIDDVDDVAISKITTGVPKEKHTKIVEQKLRESVYGLFTYMLRNTFVHTKKFEGDEYHSIIFPDINLLETLKTICEKPDVKEYLSEYVKKIREGNLVPKSERDAQRDQINKSFPVASRLIFLSPIVEFINLYMKDTKVTLAASDKVEEMKDGRRKKLKSPMRGSKKSKKRKSKRKFIGKSRRKPRKSIRRDRKK